MCCNTDGVMHFGSIFLFLTTLLAFAHAWKTYDGYKLLEVDPTSPLKREVLRELARHSIIDVDGPLKRVGKFEFIVSPSLAHQVLNTLTAAEIKYVIKEENIGRILAAEKARLDIAHKERMNVFDVNDWNRLEAIDSQLSLWAASCVAGVECSAYSIGKSYENRDLNVFKIGKKGGGTRKAMWLDATIHSREWISTGTMLKLIDHFVTKYNTDTDVKNLVDTYDWYFLPVHNPDGYAKTWDVDRNWRKNTRPDPKDPRCIGVDLNRNYDVNWGKEGVHHYPCSSIFCGRSANSEPETKAVVKEVQRISSDQSIVSFITYHGYGKMWMFPWGNTVGFDGWRCERTTNHKDLMSVATATANAIEDTYNTKWQRGTSCEVIYPTTGGSDDWARYKLGVKYTFNPELRGRNFVIDKEEIPLSFEENWNGLKAHVAKIEEIEEKKRP